MLLPDKAIRQRCLLCLLHMNDRPINDIVPYLKNAKKHPARQVKQIADSIKAFGFNQPVVVDKQGVIIVGHGRYEAAKLLGLTEVPVLQVDLTEEQAKAYRLADNRLNESEWDMKIAIEELKGLSEDMFKLTGFDKGIFDVEEDDFNAEEEYGKITTPVVQLGNIFKLGNHKLMCGDSTKQEDVAKLMGEEKAQMVFTDPPYNVNYDYTVTFVEGRTRKEKFHAFDDDKTPEAFTEFIKKVFENAFAYTNDSASFYCWHASKTSRQFEDGIKAAGWYISQVVYWLKNNCTFNRGLDYLWITEPCFFGWKPKKQREHYVDKKVMDFKNIIMLQSQDFQEMIDVMYSAKDKISDYIHPTQKPIKLAERAIKKHSRQGDIVLDLFNGSGSTIMACEQMHRRCYSLELDPKFVDVAILRWEKFTSQKAVKL